MTWKEKLINLLKTVPAIKEDLEELRMWTKFEMNWFEYHIINVSRSLWTVSWIRRWWIESALRNVFLSKVGNISNALDYHHIMMYMYNWEDIESIILWNEMLIRKHWNIISHFYIWDFDKLKPFDQQDDSVYEALYDYLK